MFLGLPDPDPLVRDMDLNLDINVPSKNNKPKNLFVDVTNENSRSISQKYGSADPDQNPYQNFMDPQHCFLLSCTVYVAASIACFIDITRNLFALGKY